MFGKTAMSAVVSIIFLLTAFASASAIDNDMAQSSGKAEKPDHITLTQRISQSSEHYFEIRTLHPFSVPE